MNKKILFLVLITTSNVFGSPDREESVERGVMNLQNINQLREEDCMTQLYKQYVAAAHNMMLKYLPIKITGFHKKED